MGKNSIDTAMLSRISIVLERNFFIELSDEMGMRLNKRA